MIKALIAIVASLLFVAVSTAPTRGVAPGRPAPDPHAPDRHERVSASVYYKDLMLLVSTKDGVAAIVFDDDIEQGVNYRYRFLANGSDKSQIGEGKVFEKYKHVPGMRGGTGVVDDGGQLFIIAGLIKLEWSLGGTGLGWVYYMPEEMHVQIGHAKDFEKVDLKRFAM